MTPVTDSYDYACSCDVTVQLMAALHNVELAPCALHNPEAVVAAERAERERLAREDADQLAGAVTELKNDSAPVSSGTAAPLGSDALLGSLARALGGHIDPGPNAA